MSVAVAQRSGVGIVGCSSRGESTHGPRKDTWWGRRAVGSFQKLRRSTTRSTWRDRHGHVAASRSDEAYGGNGDRNEGNEAHEDSEEGEEEENGGDGVKDEDRIGAMGWDEESFDEEEDDDDDEEDEEEESEEELEEEEEYEDDPIVYEPPKFEWALGELFEEARIAVEGPDVQDLIITGIQHDSRLVRPGDLFVCVTGINRDGHDFAAVAVANGASAVLAMRPLEEVEEQAREILARRLEENLQKIEEQQEDATDDFLQGIAEAWWEELRISSLRDLVKEEQSAYEEAKQGGLKAKKAIELREIMLRYLSKVDWLLLARDMGICKVDLMSREESSRSSPFGGDWAGKKSNVGGNKDKVEPEDLPINKGHIPILITHDTTGTLARLASTFYEDPSKDMSVVGITGTNGKTTTSWLVRGVFEQARNKTGMIGTIEYAIAEERLTPQGGIWAPEEEDPSAELEHQPFQLDQWVWARERAKNFEKCRMDNTKAAIWKPECTTAPPRDWIVPYQGRYSAPFTTPDSVQVQQLMAGMLKNDGSACVMEVSSHALALGRTSEVDFDIAVFTNLSRDHMDFHRTVEDYRAAKGLLFQRLNDPSRQRAVINADDPEAPFFIQCSSRVPVITYGIDNPDADVKAEEIRLSLFDTEILITTPAGNLEIVTPLLGKTNVYNILAAVAVGCGMGFPLEDIVVGIEAVEAIPGRFELIDEGQPFPVIVDYAHTPDALEKLLDSVREIGPRRIITVVGCGGDRDKGKRPQMGKIAHEKSDIVFLTNDNPRNEDPAEIIQDMVAGFPPEVQNYQFIDGLAEAHNFYWLQDYNRVPDEYDIRCLECQSELRRFILECRYSAIRAAIGMADEGDAVVIAGKGHEDYQIYGKDPKTGEAIKVWFDDRMEARAALLRVNALRELGVDTRNLPFKRDGEVGTRNYYFEPRLSGRGHTDEFKSEYSGVTVWYGPDGHQCPTEYDAPPGLLPESQQSMKIINRWKSRPGV